MDMLRSSSNVSFHSWPDTHRVRSRERFDGIGRGRVLATQKHAFEVPIAEARNQKSQYDAGSEFAAAVNPAAHTVRDLMTGY